MLALLTAMALAAPDPCAPVSPAASPDPASAELYRSVAAAEEAVGHGETAIAAWRSAAAADPADTVSRQALARHCREAGARRGPAADPLTEGIGLLDAGRYREAAERFRDAQRRGAGADAALLEGICRYELGEDAEAARLLALAEADPEHRATARLYRGLVALREGAAHDAAALFDAAAANPAVAVMATDLARTARWEGPLSLSLQAEGGYDSDVSLTSKGKGPSSPGDAVGGVGALGIWRPFGANGLYLRAGGAAQKYPRLSAYDLTRLDAAAGWRWWQGASGVTAEYAFSSRTLGGQQFLTSHQLLAIGAWGLGPVTLSAAWQGRLEQYAQTWSGYSGFAQRGDARVSVMLGSSVRIGAGWAIAHDDTDTAVLAWLEQGPRADVRIALGPRTRIAAEVGRSERLYEGLDPALLVRQRDVVTDGALSFEQDLNPKTTLRLSLLVRNSQSNVAGFEYTKIVPTAGIGVVLTP